MVRMLIGAALAYGAYRVGREIMNSVPDIERGRNAADSPQQSARKPRRRTPAKPASPTASAA